MQTVGGGIETDVTGHHPAERTFVKAGGVRLLMDVAALRQGA
jgi:hypothetical protein